MLLEDVKDISQVRQMFCIAATIYEDVIKEYNDELPQIFMKYVIHRVLEGCGRVRQPKGHDQKLVVTCVGLKRCLASVFVSHSDLMIAGFEVQLGENFCLAKFVERVFH